jgi:hypothetical protein
VSTPNVMKVVYVAFDFNNPVVDLQIQPRVIVIKIVVVFVMGFIFTLNPLLFVQDMLIKNVQKLSYSMFYYKMT